MANNQPNVEKEVDQELEDLKGKVPGLAEALAIESGEEEVEEEVEEKPEIKKEETKSEEEEESEEEEDEEEKPDKDSSKNSRPEKYIPIKQYVSEKDSWKGTVAEKDKRIAELEGIVNGKPETKTNDAAIKAYAEKHGVDEDSVRDLVSTVRSEIEGDKPKEKEKIESKLSDEQQQKLEEADQIKAEKLFNEEFTSLAVPELKTLYPKATPEQLEKAKAEMEKLATTKSYLDKSLDYVVFKERKVFDKIFTQPRKGPEGKGSGADRGASSYTVDDFKGGKTSFSELVALPAEEQARIVEQMDRKTYDAFSNWNDSNDDLVINRGGRRLKA